MIFTQLAPEPSLQINYGPGVQDVLEHGALIAKQLANLQLRQKIDPRPEAQQNGEQGGKTKAQEAIIAPAKIHSGASAKRNGGSCCKSESAGSV